MSWQEFDYLASPDSGAEDKVYGVHWNAMMHHGLRTPCYYLIFKDGSTFYARDGVTGKVTSNSDFAALLNNRIPTMTSGGILHIVVGDYPVSTQINVIDDIIVEGEGDGTRLYLPNGQPSVAEKHRILDVYNHENVLIRDLCLDGNYTNNNVTGLAYEGTLRVVNSRHVDIERCTVKNARVFGIIVYSLSGTGEDVYDVNVYKCKVIECKWNGISYYHSTASSHAAPHDCLCKNNYVIGSCDIGLDMMATGSNNLPYDVTFKDNFVIADGTSGYGSTTDTWIPIRIEAGNDIKVIDNRVFNVKGTNTHSIFDSSVYDVQRLIITGNKCYGASYAAIRLIKSNDSIVKHNTIMTSGRGILVETDRNIIKDNVITSTYYGIVETAGAAYNKYFLNNLENCTNKMSLSGSDYDIKDNIGYVTEAQGTSTILNGNSSVVVTHGLAGTPDYIYVTGDHSQVASLYVDTITSTQFTIHTTYGNVTANRVICWYAKFKP